MRRFGRWRGLAAVSFILGAILSSRSVSASDPFTLKAELGNPLGNLPGDIFGFSVAMSRDGSTDVVSGMQSGSEGGVAYVYLRPWRGWATRPVPSSTLRVPSAAVAAGVAVATNADGSLVAVEPLSGNLSGNNTTVLDVMVYVRPKGGWNGPSSPAAQLHAPLANNSPTFGLSMSGDGGTVVIGRPGDGDALVFVRPAGGWTGHLEATAALVKPPDAATNFGFSTAVSGDGAWIAVGAPSVVNGATGQGGVQVYRRPTGGWSGTPTRAASLLDPAAASAKAVVGLSVSIDDAGETVATNGNVAIFQAGSSPVGIDAIVFSEPVGGWSGECHPAARLTPSLTPQSFVLTVSLAGDGSTVACSTGTVTGTSSNASFTMNGAAVFTRGAEGWNDSSLPSGALDVSPSEMPQIYGWSLATNDSGRRWIVGSFDVPTTGASSSSSSSPLLDSPISGDAVSAIARAFVFELPPGPRETIAPIPPREASKVHR